MTELESRINGEVISKKTSGKKYVQYLYDELEPEILSHNTNINMLPSLPGFQGKELEAILPILSELEQFRGCELEVIDRYSYTNDKDIPTPTELHTVALHANVRGNKKVKIYSLTFSPGFYQHNISRPSKKGAYITPRFRSEADFHLLKSIIVNVDLSKLLPDNRIDTDPVLLPDGFMIDEKNLVSLDATKAEMFSEIIGEFSRKLYKVLNVTDLNSPSDKPEESDLPSHGRVAIRMTPDSYTIHGDMNSYTPSELDYFKC